ncbi:MAG: SagB/ThcOx family dehydrogenase, partial [bacterium]
ARPSSRPDPFKDYDDAKTVDLMTELPEGGLWEALKNRRSRRSFTGEALEKAELSRLVFAAQGPTAKKGSVILRTAPSAGALYPIETYLVINNVKDVEEGVYHYNIRKFSLERIKKGSFGSEIAEAALGQGLCAKASAVFVWTAIADRIKWKYAQRGYRYIYMEAGHICENVYLAAQDRGIGCCGIGAFYDPKLDELLEVDGENEFSIYIATVGPVKEDME